MEAVETVRQFGVVSGLLIIIIVAIGVFIYKKGWPWVTGQFESFAIERREQWAGFKHTLELNNQTSALMVEKLSELNTTVRSMHHANQRAKSNSRRPKPVKRDNAVRRKR